MRVDLKVVDLVALSEDTTVDAIGNSKDDRIKIGAKEAKFKN